MDTKEDIWVIIWVIFSETKVTGKCRTAYSLFSLFYEWPRIVELHFINGCVLCTIHYARNFFFFHSKRSYSWPFVSSITFCFCIGEAYKQSLCARWLFANVRAFQYTHLFQMFVTNGIIHDFVTALRKCLITYIFSNHTAKARSSIEKTAREGERKLKAIGWTSGFKVESKDIYTAKKQQ